MTAHALAGALADDVRRRVFAALVLGATDAAQVAERAGLPAREVATALRRLTDAGLVTGTDGALAVDAGHLRDLARTPRPARPSESREESVLRTFVRDGVLVGLPAQRGRRRIVLEHIARRSFAPDTAYPEREVDDALRPWCADGGSDHVTLRRYLVDELLLTRERGVYRRP
ncbi:DUF2087 domain-containing protein [Micromonospora globbae]|jgi:hypothetical protein|uniref:DUF2087 domain-containing protein n=1 Tax=Micromonospora globbae TaxID=1894969 RepID=A0A420EW08_9ACTN|nr:DUF2087 domain-containing protein [Micromonospora globbae]RKF24946.1 DUF2087 domain-containing protein [Micromonospora globbae]